jgi:DNA-binding protein WhiA
VSLSDDLRAELAAIAPTKNCDILAELSGLFHAAGTVHLRGRGNVSVHLDVGASATARRGFALLRGVGVASEIRTYNRHAFDRAKRYQLHVAGDGTALRVLRAAGILTQRRGPLDHPPRRVVARSCCRGAYLRGALLGAGTITGPRDLHLEIRSATPEGAQFVADLARREGAQLRVHDRGRHAIAYAKGAEEVGAVLAAAAAANIVLALEEQAVMGATRARANRLANADHANLVRTSRAAHDQLAAVEHLRTSGELAKLDDALREIADLRARHPTLPLRELARKCRPPATKATAHRRLRKLLQIADN